MVGTPPKKAPKIPAKKRKSKQRAAEDAALLQSGSVLGVSTYNNDQLKDRALQLRMIQKDEAAKLKSRKSGASHFSATLTAEMSHAGTKHGSRMRASNQTAAGAMAAPREYQSMNHDDRRDESRFSQGWQESRHKK